MCVSSLLINCAVSATSQQPDDSLLASPATPSLLSHSRYDLDGPLLGKNVLLTCHNFKASTIISSHQITAQQVSNANVCGREILIQSLPPSYTLPSSNIPAMKSRSIPRALFLLLPIVTRTAAAPAAASQMQNIFWIVKYFCQHLRLLWLLPPPEFHKYLLYSLWEEFKLTKPRNV